MIALVAMLLTGCSPQPASIKFDGEATVTVHKLDAVPMNKATVLDKDKKALEPQPALACTANPANVATLDKGQITPKANGSATVECKVNEVKASYKFVVALPDKVEIAGYTAGSPWPVGQATMLTATVKAGADNVDGQTVTWSSNNEAVATVDAKGNVMGVSAGKATITATSGTLSATVDVEIGGAAAVATDAPKDEKGAKDAKATPAAALPAAKPAAAPVGKTTPDAGAQPMTRTRPK